MSYNNWIIILSHVFKPNKIKNKLNPLIDHNYYNIANNTATSNQSYKSKSTRLMLSYTFSVNNSKISKYSF